MGLKFLVKEDVEPVDLKANILVLVASGVCAGDVWLMSDTSLNDDILDAVKHLVVVNTISFEPLTQLEEVPLA